MKKKNLIVGIAIALCAILVIVIGALWMKDSNKKSEDGTADAKIETNADAENQEVVSTMDELRAEEGFEIETPYCTIYFPTKWQEQVTVEKQEGDVYTLQFFGTVEGKDTQHLFDLQFGGTEGFALGTLTTADGNEVVISAAFAEDTMDESWTEEEKLTIYAMQEDINYIIAKLDETEGFKIVQ